MYGSNVCLGQDEVQKIRFLGRTITLTDQGIEWEGDSKHVPAFLEKLEKEFGADDIVRRDKLKGVKTPGVKKTDEDKTRTPMSKERDKYYRGLVVWANFMSQDRADISFVLKRCRST